MYEVVRYTPGGTRFVWAGPFDTWGMANFQAIEDRALAYKVAFELGGDALFEPIRIVVEKIDYEESVCANCGRSEQHTPTELAICIDSVLGPPRTEDE